MPQERSRKSCKQKSGSVGTQNVACKLKRNGLLRKQRLHEVGLKPMLRRQEQLKKSRPLKLRSIAPARLQSRRSAIKSSCAGSYIRNSTRYSKLAKRLVVWSSTCPMSYLMSENGRSNPA